MVSPGNYPYSGNDQQKKKAHLNGFTIKFSFVPVSQLEGNLDPSRPSAVHFPGGVGLIFPRPTVATSIPLVVDVAFLLWEKCREIIDNLPLIYSSRGGQIEVA